MCWPPRPVPWQFIFIRSDTWQKIKAQGASIRPGGKINTPGGNLAASVWPKGKHGFVWCSLSLSLSLSLSPVSVSFYTAPLSQHSYTTWCLVLNVCSSSVCLFWCLLFSIFILFFFSATSFSQNPLKAQYFVLDPSSLFLLLLLIPVSPHALCLICIY